MNQRVRGRGAPSGGNGGNRRVLDRGSAVWRLENAAGELVCDVIVDGAEDFALHGELRPGPALGEAVPWFAADAEADEADRHAIQDHLNARFVLRDPRGNAAELFSFFVRGNRAGFRWAPW